MQTVHAEGDELVLTFLALRLADAPGSYHLRGTLGGDAAEAFNALLLRSDSRRSPSAQLESGEANLLYGPVDREGVRRPRYDESVYGGGLFIHPPVYPYALAAFTSVAGVDFAVLLSSLCHSLTVALVAVLGRRTFNEPTGLMAAGVMAVEAVSWVSAERVWIDAMLQTAVTAAVLAALWSARGGGLWRFGVAGLALGLAGLTKFSAALVIPAVLMIWILGGRRPARREMTAFIVAAGAPVGCWLALNLAVTGRFLPFHRPTPWMIDHHPFVAQMVDRPAAYYLVPPLLASPVLLFALPALRRVRSARPLWIPITWAASVWLGVTVLGLLGVGFQLRYLAPGLPAVCLLAGVGLASIRLPWRIVGLASGALTLHRGMKTASTAGAVDPPVPHDLFMIVWEVCHYRLATWVEWMW